MKQKGVTNHRFWIISAFFGIISAVILTRSMLVRDGGSQIGSRKSVTLGAILPLTGELASFGQGSSLAIEMALEDLVAAKILDSGEVHLTVEDSRSSAKEGVSSLRNLLQSHLDVVLAWSTFVSMPLIPILTRENIPFIPLSVHPTIQNLDERVFRFYPGLEDEMFEIAHHADRMGAKKVAIVFINTPELEVAIKNAFTPALQEKGISLVAMEPHTFSTTDFRSIMANIASKKPDLVIVEDFGPLLPAMVEAARNAGLRDLVGGLGFMGAPESARSKLRGIPFVAPAAIVRNSPEFRAIAERYKERSSGATVTYDVLFTYDAVTILGRAIAESRRSDATLMSLLARNASFDGIVGKVEINERAMKIPTAWGQFDEAGQISPLEVFQSG
jgi:branched-chain amino acid transport system substrate-binding protein